CPNRVVNLRSIAGLDGVAFTPEVGLTLGALATLAQIETSDDVQRHYPAIAEAAGHAATPQIRNAATIGGNLLQRPRCWYFRSELFHCRRKGGATCFATEGENQYHAIFDNQKCAIVHPSGAAIPLVAMGAEIELTGPNGKRRVK